MSTDRQLESSGYCTASCDELSDELGQFALCAYHRDHPEEVRKA